MRHEMVSRSVAPKAVLFNIVTPILAQGAALAGMALCDRSADGDVTLSIRSGDRVTVDPAGLRSSATEARARQPPDMPVMITERNPHAGGPA